jgi:hypothetical protein
MLQSLENHSSLVNFFNQNILFLTVANDIATTGTTFSLGHWTQTHQIQSCFIQLCNYSLRKKRNIILEITCMYLRTACVREGLQVETFSRNTPKFKFSGQRMSGYKFFNRNYKQTRRNVACREKMKKVIQSTISTGAEGNGCRFPDQPRPQLFWFSYLAAS